MEEKPKRGPPFKYSPELVERAREYVAGGYEQGDEVVPSAAGLARYCKASTSSLYNWAKEHDEFQEILDELNDVQHMVALNKGLNNVFNAAITKLLLHNHGYSDRNALEHSGPNGSPLNIIFDAKDESI